MKFGSAAIPRSHLSPYVFTSVSVITGFGSKSQFRMTRTDPHFSAMNILPSVLNVIAVGIMRPSATTSTWKPEAAYIDEASKKKKEVSIINNPHIILLKCIE